MTWVGICGLQSTWEYSPLESSQQCHTGRSVPPLLHSKSDSSKAITSSTCWSQLWKSGFLTPNSLLFQLFHSYKLQGHWRGWDPPSISPVTRLPSTKRLLFRWSGVLRKKQDYRGSQTCAGERTDSLPNLISARIIRATIMPMQECVSVILGPWSTPISIMWQQSHRNLRGKWLRVWGDQVAFSGHTESAVTQLWGTLLITRWKWLVEMASAMNKGIEVRCTDELPS